MLWKHLVKNTTTNSVQQTNTNKNEQRTAYSTPIKYEIYNKYVNCIAINSGLRMNNAELHEQGEI